MCTCSRLIPLIFKVILHSQADTRARSICHSLCQAFGRARALLRDVGVAACVPIEPEMQTELIDATMQVWGLGFGV